MNLLALLVLSTQYVTFESDRYSFEIPAGWTVGAETPWGAREVSPVAGPGRLGAMTAGPTRSGWDELYRTSLYFIKREAPGQETPYRKEKTAMGYEAISFEIINREGWANRRYTLLRAPGGTALALNVKIPDRNSEEDYIRWFRHMVNSAKIKEPSRVDRPRTSR